LRILGLFIYRAGKALPQYTQVKSILLFCPPRLGDNVFMLPVLETLRAAFGKAKLTLAVNEYAGDFYSAIKDPASLLIYSRKRFGILNALCSVHRQKFDIALDFTCDYTLLGALFAYASRAPVRAGYNIQNRGIFFTHLLKPGSAQKHIVDELLALVECLKIPVQNRIPHINIERPLNPPQGDLNLNPKHPPYGGDGGRICTKEKNTIGLHPGGHYKTQRWPAEKFSALAQRIIKEFDAQVVILAGPSERELANTIKGEAAGPIQVKVLANSRELIQALINCDALVCNNSGPLHLAAALSIPTVSTMGPTIAQRWWPLGNNHFVAKKDLACIGCNGGTCKINTRDCMELITVAEIYKAINTLLAGRKRL
jgi:heptosyltransferase II